DDHKRSPMSLGRFHQPSDRSIRERRIARECENIGGSNAELIHPPGEKHGTIRHRGHPVQDESRTNQTLDKDGFLGSLHFGQWSGSPPTTSSLERHPAPTDWGFSTGIVSPPRAARRVVPFSPVPVNAKRREEFPDRLDALTPETLRLFLASDLAQIHRKALP